MPISHTSEPWEANGTEFSQIVSEYVLVDLGETHSDLGDDIDQANAQRIVACVNFCKGFTNEQLTEPGLVIYEP